MVYALAVSSLGYKILYSTKPPGLLLSDEVIIDICLATVSVLALMALIYALLVGLSH